MENDNRTSAQLVNRLYYNWLPDARLLIKLDKGETLAARYAGNSINPTIEQLQPVPNLGNPYLVRLGNSGLRPAFIHSLDLSYLSFSSEHFRNLQLHLMADIDQGQIGTSTTTLAGGVQQLQYVNLNGVYHLRAGGTYGFPLISQEHGSGSVSSGLNYNHEQTLVNGQADLVASHGVNGEFRINYRIGSKLFVESTAAMHYMGNQYSLPGENDSRTLQQDYMLDVSCMLPFSVTAGGHYSLQVRNTSGIPAQQSSLLNAFLGKDLFGGHAAQLRLSGFNLLDAASSLNQVTGQNFIQTTQTNTQKRLLLLSLVYNFRKFNTGG